MAELSRKAIEDFRHTILDNFTESGRSFPWRKTYDPYHILVSEIMLQQTQTDRVVPKYENWLSVFPNAATLASAPLSEVLVHWSGLGYNRRARFLQDACAEIITSHNGIFPSDPDELDALPGIGPYTARAVSTFAFGLPNVFIETNIRAVFIFFFFADKPGVTDKEILELIGETLWTENPRIWYYALMDYGAVLKKKVGNPNRMSKHYTVQKKFEGSNRQARGAIVRHLGKYGTGSAQSIGEGECISAERIEAAAASLVSEGLVCETNGIYRIT